MTILRPAALLLALCAVTACVPRRAAPPPVVAPPPPVVQAPRPAPPPPPPPPPPSVDWADAPLSPGNWSYRPSPQGPSAVFGPGAAPSLTVRCFGNQVLISRSGASASNQLTFRTSSIARAVPAAAQPADIGVTLPANDPLLDALIFSRGRFAVEAAGLPGLVVPTWPELARVVEDCRRGGRSG